jgi:hypothetical protein
MTIALLQLLIVRLGFLRDGDDGSSLSIHCDEET